MFVHSLVQFANLVRTGCKLPHQLVNANWGASCNQYDYFWTVIVLHTFIFGQLQFYILSFLDSCSFTYFYFWTVLVLHTFRKLGNLHLPLCTLGLNSDCLPIYLLGQKHFCTPIFIHTYGVFLCRKFFQLHPQKEYAAVLGCNKD